jgi:sec-independent protein translocase protein TatB
MFDFGVGYSELFVLAIIAVLVIGPKDLPKVLRTFGQFMRKMRGMASEFQGHVNEAMKETGVESLKKDMQSLKETVGAQAKAVETATAKATGTTPSPSIPTFPYMGNSPARDFAAYFGEGAKGETRVAGSLVLPDA